MIDIITVAIAAGAKLYGSISGGKDGDAMIESIVANRIPLQGLIHADLGRTEWKESLPQCRKCADQFDLPLHIVTRKDGLDMLDIWQKRMHQLEGTGKPFWPSSSARYCTSDMKRDQINIFLNNCGHDLVISCEGIRAGESTARAKKQPLEIRDRITSSFYSYSASDIKTKKPVNIWMDVEEAIANFTPGKRLALTWYPILNYSLQDVWATKGQSCGTLALARIIYQQTGSVPSWWPFHPAYAYGNDRVSCAFCIMGSLNDLQNGAKHHPELLGTLISMEDESGATFKNKWSLKQLLLKN